MEHLSPQDHSGRSTQPRREQLLDAAARCFARGGFHATTVAEISLEAECSPGLLYRYFAGKDALVAALVEREAERTVAALTSVRASSDLLFDLDQAAEQTVTDWDDARSAALHIQIIAEASRGSAVTEPVRRHFADVTAALAETLRAGQQAGAVDGALDPAETARVLVAMVSGLTLMRAVDADPARPAPSDTARLLLARMLVPRPPSSPAEGGPL
jgi:AcrR family transcriptional regulator